MKLSIMAMFALAHAALSDTPQQPSESSLSRIYINSQTHIKNKNICELLRDKAYEDSCYFDKQYSSNSEPVALKMLKGFSEVFEKPSTVNMKKTLKQFGHYNCYENEFLPAIDRELLKKLDNDLKK